MSNAVVVLASSSSHDDNTNQADSRRTATSSGIKDSIAVHKKKGFHHTASDMKEEASCDGTDLETESETSKEDNDDAQYSMGLGPSTTSPPEEVFDNKTRKSVSFAVNIDGSVQCQTRIVERLDKEDCWYTPEEKDVMTDNFSRLVKFYQLSRNRNDDDCDIRAYIHALTRLQKESHKMTMPQACQHLATLGLHSNHTRGLESYVICDIFDYLRQKHLVRILMAQNQLEEQYGMYYDRQQGGGDDDVENIITKELGRTSLRWSVRSSQYARLIALLDKHAAREALASPWDEQQEEEGSAPAANDKANGNNRSECVSFATS